MLEKDIQEYLFDNPNILFPGKKISEKTKEYYIHGKRIDLLFMVDGIRYIVEIKRNTIEREHVGQIFEYYGLMRKHFAASNLKLILVAPNIPEYRTKYLEEHGIRCLELKNTPEGYSSKQKIIKKSEKSMKEDSKISLMLGRIGENDRFTFEVMCLENNPNGKSLPLCLKAYREILPRIHDEYSAYDPTPHVTRTSITKEFDYDSPIYKKEITFEKGRAWFAINFSENNNANEVPNISIIFGSSGFDITIDAETLSSEKIFIEKIEQNQDLFDSLLEKHGKLYLKTYQKYEHQPLCFHWILTDNVPPSQFDSKEILNTYYSHKKNFHKNRDYWVETIIDKNEHIKNNTKLVNRLRKANKSFNLALRLSVPIKKDDSFWNLTFEEQIQLISNEIIKMKPLIDFFI